MEKDMEWWAIISSTVTAEFSDITDLEDATRVSSRLLIATILGGLLGYERERKRKAAGLRTHMLVALGAALTVQVFVVWIVLIPFERWVPHTQMWVGLAGVAYAVYSLLQFFEGRPAWSTIWRALLGYGVFSVLSSVAVAMAIFVLMPRLERHTALRAARKRREANRAP